MTHHGVKDGQQLAHAGDERHFLGLAGLEQALVTGAQDRVEPHCRHRRHIESGTDWGASAGSGPTPAHGATVTVRRCHADERSDLLMSKSTELGHLS